MFSWIPGSTESRVTRIGLKKDKEMRGWLEGGGQWCEAERRWT
jgi:hypothetical protein